MQLSLIVRKFSTQIRLDRVIQNCPKTTHIPVMVKEVLNYLQPAKDNIILDMTFGSGGHSKKILENEPDVKILALDRDPEAYSYACEMAEKYPNKLVPLLGKFSDLPQLLYDHGYKANTIDSMIFDLGYSSMQFESSNRGFSMSKNGPLDMRMDGDRDPSALTAMEILARAKETDLYQIIKYYGQERKAKKIARALIETRYLFKQITTTQELADVVESTMKNSKDDRQNYSDTHAAKKTFQALRLFVNNELNETNYGLILANHYLKIGGRIVTITNNMLLDTIIKRHVAGNLIESSANPLPLKYCNYNANVQKMTLDKVMQSNWKMLHKHVILPTDEEIAGNPLCRNAKLRAAVKIS